MPLEIIDDADLSSRLSLRLHARVDRLIRVHHAQELPEARQAVRGPYRGLLGEGSNSVMGSSIHGTLVQPAWAGLRRLDALRVEADAGIAWDTLVNWTLSQGLSGLENLSMIPGSVGAAPVQNIGAYGVELAEHLESLDAFDWQTCSTRRFERADCGFAYRDSVFRRPDAARWVILRLRLRLQHARTTVSPKSTAEPAMAVARGRAAGYAPTAAPLTCEEDVLRLDHPDLARHFARHRPESAREVADAVRSIRARKLPDPTTCPNAGSFFHNPVIRSDQARELLAREPDLVHYPDNGGLVKLSAAWMIERCGLKGQRSGRVGVSGQHALVLVNHGAASGEELIAFAEQVRRAVQERFKVWLSIEPRVMLR